MRFFYGLIFCASFSLLQAQENKKVFSIALIGDAGNLESPGPLYSAWKEITGKDENSATLFLGDNIYFNGLPSRDAYGDGKLSAEEKKLRSQLFFFRDYAGFGYMIPGNHDWKAGRSKGFERVKNMETWVHAWVRDSGRFLKNKEGAVFLPGAGIPGPWSVVPNEGLRTDSQWFFAEARNKPRGKVPGMSYQQTREKYFRDLDSLLGLAERNNEWVVFAGHHPMKNFGQHAKAKQPWRFILNYTPFWIFGKMGLHRLMDQDIPSGVYRKYIAEHEKVFHDRRKIIFVAGHEHNYQWISANGFTYIVSGNGSKAEKLQKGKFPALKEGYGGSKGFVCLDFFRNDSGDLIFDVKPVVIPSGGSFRVKF
jgi:hypothetical protein